MSSELNIKCNVYVEVKENETKAEAEERFYEEMDKLSDSGFSYNVHVIDVIQWKDTKLAYKSRRGGEVKNLLEEIKKKGYTVKEVADMAREANKTGSRVSQEYSDLRSYLDDSYGYGDDGEGEVRINNKYISTTNRKYTAQILNNHYTLISDEGTKYFDLFNDFIIYLDEVLN